MEIPIDEGIKILRAWGSVQASMRLSLKDNNFFMTAPGVVAGVQDDVMRFVWSKTGVLGLVLPACTFEAYTAQDPPPQDLFSFSMQSVPIVLVIRKGATSFTLFEVPEQANEVSDVPM